MAERIQVTGDRLGSLASLENGPGGLAGRYKHLLGESATEQCRLASALLFRNALKFTCSLSA